jgi:hypothetical protein
MVIEMRDILLSIGLALAMAVAASASAGAADLSRAGLEEAFSPSGTIVEQRKDVDEIARPEPPSGPATPVPYCSPGSPICP